MISMYTIRQFMLIHDHRFHTENDYNTKKTDPFLQRRVAQCFPSAPFSNCPRQDLHKITYKQTHIHIPSKPISNIPHGIES